MRTLQITLILIIILIIIIFYGSINNEVTYVRSDIDNRKYLVRNLQDKEHAANMLARIRNNVLILTDHLVKNKNKSYKEYKKYIDQLNRRIRDTVINESNENSAYTSYSVNKGEQIVFCIRSKKKKNQIHKLNLVMYVALHELAHVACPEQGHTDLFKYIFAFLTQVAMDINMYKKIPFNETPKEYCGLVISESIV